MLGHFWKTLLTPYCDRTAAVKSEKRRHTDNVAAVALFHGTFNIPLGQFSGPFGWRRKRVDNTSAGAAYKPINNSGCDPLHTVLYTHYSRLKKGRKG